MFLTSSLWMARIRSLAASQLIFLPVMTIISELLFSVGRSILVLVSSRICSHAEVLSSSAFFFSRTKPATMFSNLPSRSHLLNVGAALADDVLVELLEDGHGEREAALNLQEGRQSCISVGRTEKVAIRSRRDGGSYQVHNDFLEELGAFLHLVLGSPQLDDVALLRRVGEVNNHLKNRQ